MLSSHSIFLTTWELIPRILAGETAVLAFPGYICEWVRQAGDQVPTLQVGAHPPWLCPEGRGNPDPQAPLVNCNAVSALQEHRTQLDTTAAPGPTARVSRGEGGETGGDSVLIRGLVCLRDITCPPGLLAEPPGDGPGPQGLHPSCTASKPPRMMATCEARNKQLTSCISGHLQ